MNVTHFSSVAVAIAIVLAASARPAAATEVPAPRQSTVQSITSGAESVSTWAGNTGSGLSVVTGAANGVAEYVEHTASNTAANAKALASMSQNPVKQTGYTAMAEHTLRQGVAEADAMRGAIAPLEKAGHVASVVSYAATGTQIAGQIAGGNYNDAAIAAGQLATEEAVARGGAHLANAVCGPPCAAVYGAGNAAGTLIKQIDTCSFRDCGPGGSYTVGDGVTDVEFGIYQKVKFALDPSQDPMSDEFADKVRAQAQANRDRYTQQADALRIQQEQLDQQRMASVPTSTPTGTPDSGGGVADLLTAIVNGAVQYQQLQSTYAPSSQGRSKPTGSSANPTGCHPGHDEQAHPGGCLDYSGMRLN